MFGKRFLVIALFVLRKKRLPIVKYLSVAQLPIGTGGMCLHMAIYELLLGVPAHQFQSNGFPYSVPAYVYVSSYATVCLILETH